MPEPHEASGVESTPENGEAREQERCRHGCSVPAALSLRSVPGIGLLTATALIASVGDPSRFPSGRRLASSSRRSYPSCISGGTSGFINEAPPSA